MSLSSTSRSGSALLKLLREAIPCITILSGSEGRDFIAAILLTYATNWKDKDHFDDLDGDSLASLYRTTLGAITGGIHPENQEKVMQWTLNQTTPVTAHLLPQRVQDFANHAQDMMDCFYDIGHAERFPTDSPPSPAEYFELRATNAKYPEPIPMPNGYNRWYLDASSLPPAHIGCGLATPSLIGELLPAEYQCPACQELDAGTGGENQLAHMVPGGCLYDDTY
jgi:hypothetical protein